MNRRSHGFRTAGRPQGGEGGWGRGEVVSRGEYAGRGRGNEEGLTGQWKTPIHPNQIPLRRWSPQTWARYGMNRRLWKMQVNLWKQISGFQWEGKLFIIIIEFIIKSTDLPQWLKKGVHTNLYMKPYINTYCQVKRTVHIFLTFLHNSYMYPIV